MPRPSKQIHNTLLLHLPPRSLPITPRDNLLHTLIRHTPHPMTRPRLSRHIPRIYRLPRRRHNELQTILSSADVAESEVCALAPVVSVLVLWPRLGSTFQVIVGCW